MKWIGTQTVYDSVRFSKRVTFKGSQLIIFEGGLTSNDDIVIGKAVNDGNPFIRLGAQGSESLAITATYDSGAQTLDYVTFKTAAASSSANKGTMKFNVDGVHVAAIRDEGINLASSMNLSFNQVDILDDNSGTMTLQNIDALDATTIATFETAMEANLDTLESLTTVGTIGTGVWQGTAINQTYLVGQSNTNTGDEDQASINALDITEVGNITSGSWSGSVIASAKLDADTAHLTTNQTFTGIKTFESAIVGDLTGEASTVATIAGLAPNTATTQATQAAITTLAGVTSLGVASATTNIAAGDVTVYNPVNDGNPTISLGKDANDRAEITAEYHGGAQTFNRLRFRTFSSSGSGNAGRMLFQVDETSIAEFKDAGFNISSGKSLLVEGDIVLSGNGSGTCTLSNIDLLDATTEATIETAIDTLSNLTTTGTIGTGRWQGDVIASAYLDADTAHLSGAQTFTGTKTLNSFKGTAGATVTNILDEDAMGSNSATALATQQSIKAYTDTKVPNLYWFGVCDAATAAANANLGAFPSTDVSIVSFNATTLTNDTDVFTLASDEVTITRAGVYKFTYNVLLEISTGNNRTEGAIGILRDRSSTISLIDGSRSSTYNRFGRADSDDVSRMAGSVSMFIDVAANDSFYIGFFKEAHQTSNTRLQTVPSGTTWTIEAVT